LQSDQSNYDKKHHRKMRISIQSTLVKKIRR